MLEYTPYFLWKGVGISGKTIAGQYPAILTEKCWSIKNWLYFQQTFSCGTNAGNSYHKTGLSYLLGEPIRTQDLLYLAHLQIQPYNNGFYNVWFERLFWKPCHWLNAFRKNDRPPPPPPNLKGPHPWVHSVWVINENSKKNEANIQSSWLKMRGQ